MVMEFVRGETVRRICRAASARWRRRGRRASCMQVLDALGARASRRHRASRSEAGEPDGHRVRRDQGHGLRHRARPRHRAPDVGRPHDGHAGLHGAGAGAGDRHRWRARICTRLASCSTGCSRGSLPFQADTAIAMAHKQVKDPPTPLRQYRAELPDWCETVLGRALAKSPADRFRPPKTSEMRSSVWAPRSCRRPRGPNHSRSPLHLTRSWRPRSGPRRRFRRMRRSRPPFRHPRRLFPRSANRRAPPRFVGRAGSG